MDIPVEAGIAHCDRCAATSLPATKWQKRTIHRLWRRLQAQASRLAQNSVVVYSTFLGGAAGNPDDGVTHVALDSESNLWVTGTTDARDFPTVNAQQPNCALGPLGGCRDTFVAKFDPHGSLLFSTYLGGNNSDESGGGGIVIDSAGNAYVTGTWGNVAFVAKLDPDGRLLFLPQKIASAQCLRPPGLVPSLKQDGCLPASVPE